MIFISKTFYHGTSDTLKIGKMILPPIYTGIKRGIWRKTVDKVYFTPSLLLAKMYVKRSCFKYGGNPIVYMVIPIGECFSKSNIIYIADKAKVIRQVVLMK